MNNFIRKAKYILCNRKYKRIELIAYFNQVQKLSGLVDEYRTENQSLSGRIKLLEEQQEIMHNFLVEINKYLFKYSEDQNNKDS
jgi:hypothetical protein